MAVIEDDSAAPSRAALEEEIRKLRRINAVLMDRVERSLDRQGTAYALFETATQLETQIRHRTQELTTTLATLERSNLELKRAKEEAEAANRSKTRFLAAASHDVLQPLNAALLLVSSLKSVQRSSEGERLCLQVERSLDTMCSLLRTLLYMSRLDAGDVQPRLQSVALAPLFDRLESDFQPMAAAKGLEFRVVRRRLHASSDPTMLRRLLQNIVANAIRYTDRGGVLVTAVVIGERVRIRVADTGRGIPRDEFEAIFDEFQRGSSAGQSGDDDDDPTTQGMGLGLAIVQRMVQRLGHTVGLNSRSGRGSCFTLGLDAADPQVELLPTVGPAFMARGHRSGVAGTRVLLIENDLVVMQAMDQLLRQWGCDSRLASSTEEAVDALVDGRWMPDLILADQQLDRGELGTQTIRQIRARAGTKVTAVLVTADPSPELAGQAERADIELMAKPVRPAELRALIAHLRERG